MEKAINAATFACGPNPYFVWYHITPPNKWPLDHWPLTTTTLPNYSLVWPHPTFSFWPFLWFIQWEVTLFQSFLSLENKTIVIVMMVLGIWLTCHLPLWFGISHDFAFSFKFKLKSLLECVRHQRQEKVLGMEGNHNAIFLFIHRIFGTMISNWR